MSSKEAKLGRRGSSQFQVTEDANLLKVMEPTLRQTKNLAVGNPPKKWRFGKIIELRDFYHEHDSQRISQWPFRWSDAMMFRAGRYGRSMPRCHVCRFLVTGHVPSLDRWQVRKVPRQAINVGWVFPSRAGGGDQESKRIVPSLNFKQQPFGGSIVMVVPQARRMVYFLFGISPSINGCLSRGTPILGHLYLNFNLSFQRTSEKIEKSSLELRPFGQWFDRNTSHGWLVLFSLMWNPAYRI